MHEIVRLEGAIQPYDWGSRTAIAELLGAPPSDAPQAELWLGAHAKGEATVVTARGERVPLAVWIARDADAALGAGVATRFGGRLPFLLKVLAVERALSLQAHPDAAQARAGFDAGTHADGEPLYVDADAKPEMVVAHTRFRALCGFRPLAEIGAALEAVGLLDGDPIADAASLRAWLARWLDPRRDAARAARLDRALAIARGSDPAHALMRRLADEHPGDPGAVAPLLLHAVDLAPGEGLFLGPGELHCYLDGTAIEIMGASDNVLRAGLTTKTRAVAELVRIGCFEPRAPERLRAAPIAAGVAAWSAPVDCFELSAVAVDDAVSIDARVGVELLLCHEGAVQVAAEGGSALALARGQSCVVPAAAGPYRVRGGGRLYRAGVPAARVGSGPVR